MHLLIVKSLLHCLEQAAGDLGSTLTQKDRVHVLKNRRSHLCFKWQASEIRRPILAVIPHLLKATST